MIGNYQHSSIIAASVFWFIYLGKDLETGWVRWLYFSEALAQVILSTSGFLHPDRDVFSYINHKPGAVNTLLSITLCSLTLLRVYALLSIPYSPLLLLVIPVLGYQLRGFPMDKLFRVMILANLVWGVKTRSLGVVAYSVNCWVCAGLDIGWVGEIVNVWVWYQMKHDLALL
ncbi:hypothetical protein DFJ77DRAFT_473296 [Powellomyces hirtus]|nr:hypothetical protein DFJ77DRAFT_473296 [Powellomyces hirtus]